MSTGDLLAVVGIGLPLLAVGAWETWDYEYKHKPMAKEMYANFQYDRCMRECEVVCLATCKMIGVESCTPVQCEPVCKKECFRYLEQE